VYDMNTNKLKMLNLFGNGLIGRINVYHDELPESMQPVVTYSSLYYIKDHLGSIRITVDKLGNVRNAQDYYPYGEIMQNFEYGAINEKYKFTEKERDTETGYDYFKARYYDSELEKWLQVDPLSEKYWGWSPYNYSFNNPLRYFDPDGKWPEKIHNKILYEAFKDILTSREIIILQQASKFVDEDQSSIGQFKHAMREKGETVEVARNRMYEYINIKRQEFIEGKGDAALFSLGEALHPIMDITSPSHEGFQQWDENFFFPPKEFNFLTLLKAGVHIIREFKINDERFDLTVRLLRDFYKTSIELKGEK
ncbi:MAG: RHS repeat-associated core domain-containing protein, partial [Ignavibacteria bacterium]|nr:RHS repeat-associated core domain-containing protein [Ignavibacteria bacterium]